MDMRKRGDRKMGIPSESLLSLWLKTKKGRLRDVPVRVGRVVFHIPFDGSKYLMFKCRRWAVEVSRLHKPEGVLG